MFSERFREVAAVLIAAAFGTVVPGNAHGQAKIALERHEGPPMSASGGGLNEGSTLMREWLVLQDESGPVRIDGKTGIDVVYDAGRGRHGYRVSYTLKAIEPITAWEMRYVVIDVFGKVIRSHADTRVSDVSSNFGRGERRRLICGSSEASRAFASVAYVASARLASGEIYEIDRAAVLRHVQSVADKATEALLEPERPLLLLANCMD